MKEEIKEIQVAKRQKRRQVKSEIITPDIAVIDG
jgi:hypothetical protein